MTNESQSAPVAFDPNTGQPVTSLSTTPDQPGKKLLAPVWHTIVIVAIVLCNSFFTERITSHLSPQDISSVSEKGRIIQYSFTVLGEFIRLGLVVFGLRLNGKKLRDVI